MTSERSPKLGFNPTSVGLIRHAVESFGDNDFIVEPDQRITYNDADRLSRAFAKRLVKLGVGKGTRVAAKYPTGVQWVIAWLAVTRIGGIFMSLSSAYKAGETRKCLRIGDVEFFLTPTEIIGRDQRQAVDDVLGQSLSSSSKPLMIADLPFLRQVVFTSFGAGNNSEALDLQAETSTADDGVTDLLLDAMESEVVPADWMLAIFTSGSTSDPKCVIHTHGAPIRHGTAINEINEWTQTDRIFAGMPFFWVGGNCYTVMPAMIVGATVVCTEKFEAGAALDLMERERVTRVIGWPGVINPLLEHPTLGSRNIPGFRDEIWHPAVGWMTGLGMSEMASNHTALYVRDRVAGAGSVGVPIPFVDHKLVNEDTGEEVEEGETGTIYVRGYSLMAGYYKREREDVFEPDGFFNTQDRGYYRNGFLYFAGRDVGLIKTAGNNVSALEVEAWLKSQPEIETAYVVGVDDHAVGQLVGTAIVAAQDDIDVQAILQRMRAELSSYKVPKIVRLVKPEEIPFLPSGKLDFRALVSKISESPQS